MMKAYVRGVVAAAAVFAASSAFAGANLIPVTTLAPSPLDLAKLKFLGKGSITEDQATHLNDWLAIGQRLKGE